MLSFSTSETAEILGTTVVSVNSSLQRARTRVREAGVRQERVNEPSAAEQRAWVERYMEAFERADVEDLKRLLYRGRDHGDAADAQLVLRPRRLRPVHGMGLRGGREGLAAQGGRGQRRPARVRRLSARRRRVLPAHAPDLHRHRRGHQPELGLPGLRHPRDFRPGGRARRPGTRHRRGLTRRPYAVECHAAGTGRPRLCLRSMFRWCRSRTASRSTGDACRP
ncbi:hypothetical protein HTZ77_24255 [Nonomuraea sp. SMC257]|uniref:Uncharacterized protein n=1 Tax=Nonomuraea montanisoli TaxID=2741721 RepID=A0A7Y6IA75_9ACTN|nr:hypothetical protein [Nonomuraea montanisoli]